MSDILLFQTLEEGDIRIKNDDIETTEGLESALYLSMFGGNADDPGGDDRTKDWWGNLDEIDLTKRYRSETQYLLRSIPASSGNLKRIQQAAERDLGWLLSEGVASTLGVSVTIPQLNRVDIRVSIFAEGKASDFLFSENWERMV